MSVARDQYLELPLERVVWKTPIRGEEITRKDVESMSTSLMIHGQIHPIVVTPPDENGVYEGVCGRLRFLGAKHRGLPNVLARVHRFESEEEKLQWQLVENVHRREVSYADRIRALDKLGILIAKRIEQETGKKPREKTVHTTMAEEIERAAGERKVSAETIRHDLRIHRELPDDVKKLVRAYQLGRHHCTQLLRVKDPALQLWLAEEAGRAKPEKWGERKLKQVVNGFQKVSEAVKSAVLSREIALAHLEQMARLHQNQQDRVLESLKQKRWSPKETKAVVDLILQKPEEIMRVLSLPTADILAELKGERVIRTTEELREFFKELVEMPVEKWEKVHHCPQCGKVFKINWEQGTIQWES